MILASALRGVFIAIDEDGDRLRYCRACQEWWPLTPQFWRTYRRPGRTDLVCLACSRAASRRWQEAQRARRAQLGNRLPPGARLGGPLRGDAGVEGLRIPLAGSRRLLRVGGVDGRG